MRARSSASWRERLHAQAIETEDEEFDLLYHVSLRPALPREYEVQGLVAITFRLHERGHGGHRFVTALDPAAALRMGARLGLDEAGALAMVDSHERMHVQLQLEGVPEEVEEARSRVIDAVWLALRHPGAEKLLRAGAADLVVQVGHDFWERLLSGDGQAAD